MLDGRFRFESFVTGPSNRVAESAARAVAEAPGRVYQPLFLYGDPGLGKTHLLAAIGFEARQLHAPLVVQYRSGGEFVAQVRQALTRGDLQAWRREMDDVGLLLLDDVQFLAGEAEAQGELLRLLGDGASRGVQLVIAADRPPAELEAFDQRLLAGMSAGLVVDLVVPEYETRSGILWLWRTVRMLDLDDAVLDELAHADVSSVRELLRLLDAVVAQTSRAPETPAAGAAQVVAAEAVEARVVPDEFESFLNEMSAVVSSSVEQWRARLASTVARWAGEGYSTESLERFLEGVEAPDLDAIEAHFAAAVHQLRDLEQEAARLDPKLAGVSVFRDPGRLDEARAIVMRALAAYDPPPAPAEHLTLEGFSPGARNQLALRAAGEVVALPGSRYNPLYLHGPAASGKTHLGHAIANALAARDGAAWTVAVVDGAVLGEELIDALRAGTLERWRMRYRALDALVVDNVQRIGGSDRLQEEFHQLLKAMIDQARQVILTADVAPARLTAVSHHVQAQCESGLVVELGRVSEAEAVARHTPVPDGAEAAAPTIDALFEDLTDADAVASRPALMDSSGLDAFFLDPEKVVMQWPGLDGRIVEDPR